MSESDPLVKTPEQIAQVKRLSMPIGVAALVLAVAGLAMVMRGWVDAAHPPSVFGASLSFCAMMMGVGILAWAKGTPGVKWALVFSLVAVLIGAVGPFVYFKRGFDWRLAIEQKELNNVAAVAKAASAYAAKNEGRYPKDLEAMRAAGLLKAEQLHSPFGSDMETAKRKEMAKGTLTLPEFEKWFATHSDYDYLGADLGEAKLPLGKSADVLVAAARYPVMRKKLAVAFADGSSEFITMEDAGRVMDASNGARRKAGLPELRPPDAVHRATTQARAGEAKPGS